MSDLILKKSLEDETDVNNKKGESRAPYNDMRLTDMDQPSLQQASKVKWLLSN